MKSLNFVKIKVQKHLNKMCGSHLAATFDHKALTEVCSSLAMTWADKKYETYYLFI